jgi:hypothetical protein
MPLIYSVIRDSIPYHTGSAVDRDPWPTATIGGALVQDGPAAAECS